MGINLARFHLFVISYFLTYSYICDCLLTDVRTYDSNCLLRGYVYSRVLNLVLMLYASLTFGVGVESPTFRLRSVCVNIAENYHQLIMCIANEVRGTMNLKKEKRKMGIHAKNIE